MKIKQETRQEKIIRVFYSITDRVSGQWGTDYPINPQKLAEFLVEMDENDKIPKKEKNEK